MEKKWFNVAEAAEYFSIPVKTIYSLASRGLIPGNAVIRLGRQLRVDLKKIEEEGTLNARIRR